MTTRTYESSMLVVVAFSIKSSIAELNMILSIAVCLVLVIVLGSVFLSWSLGAYLRGFFH